MTAAATRIHTLIKVSKWLTIKIVITRGTKPLLTRKTERNFLKLINKIVPVFCKNFVNHPNHLRTRLHRPPPHHHLVAMTMIQWISNMVRPNQIKILILQSISSPKRKSRTRQVRVKNSMKSSMLQIKLRLQKSNQNMEKIKAITPIIVHKLK